MSDTVSADSGQYDMDPRLAGIHASLSDHFFPSKTDWRPERTISNQNSPAVTQERVWLSKVAEGSFPPIIVACGDRSSTEVFAELLSKREQGTRLLSPRLPNGGDHFKLEDTLFSYTDFDNGSIAIINLQDLAESLLDGNCSPIITISDPRILPAVQEAIGSYMPLAPVAAFYLASSDEELTSIHKGETEVFKSLFQVKDLSHYLSDPHGPVSKREGETNNDFLMAEVSNHIQAAIARAQDHACEILRPIVLNSDHSYIPREVLQTLDRDVALKAKARSLDVVLKGGVAAAALLPVSRPVSPDIDFTIPLRHSEFHKATDLMEFMGDHPVEVRAHPGRGFSQKSTKLSTSVITEDGVEVELDSVPVRRVTKYGLCFEFKYDAVSHLYRRAAVTPAGNPIYIAPPELQLVEKLVAGRGSELGKFDLYDAAGLMTQCTIYLPLIQRIIERQRYKPEIDQALEKHTQGSAPLIDMLEELGINNPELLQFIEEGLTSRGDVPGSFEFVSRGLSPDSLKRLGLINVLFNSLNRLEDLSRNDKSDYGVAKLGEEKVSTATTNMRQFLLWYVEKQLGRSDLFVRRTPKSFKQNSDYWNRVLSLYPESGDSSASIA